MNLRLKRLELCLGHMQAVPTKRVVLNAYGVDVLTGMGHDQPCGAAGCVLGHIQTIPEFREWEIKEYGAHSHDHSESRERVLCWLEYTVVPLCSKYSVYLFDGRMTRRTEGKEEAIARLEYLIAQEQEVTV